MTEGLYDSVEDFVEGVLGTADPCVIVMIAIPSHKKDEKTRIKDQDQWADAALKLFAQLFEGATGYSARGSYRSESGKILMDEPIMIESLASIKEVSDRSNIRKLGEFAFRLARKTDQECVFMAIDNVRHYVGRGK